MSFNEFLNPFERLLADITPPHTVRQIEAGGSPGALWAALEASGFLDVLVPEEAGGAGLTLTDVGPLFVALGRHIPPAPVAETMLARCLLAEAGVVCPAGPIILAVADRDTTPPIPYGQVAEHVLLQTGDQLGLVAADAAAMREPGAYHGLAERFAWHDPWAGAICAAPPGGLRTIAALVRSCLIAGAAGRILDMTVSYANQRVQFGRRIGQQQALQQQLAVMAQQVIAARLASEAACAAGLPADELVVAAAKQMCGTAAAQVANIAHAVHGAIGISEEYDLQLFTRRLHEWRLADGSPHWWALRLGEARMASSQTSTDFVRAHLAPT